MPTRALPATSAVPDPSAGETHVTGHLQVRGPAGRRKYVALWTDREGGKHTTTLGSAHVKDSGRRTQRGAVVWRAAGGPCPDGHLTPKLAQDALDALLGAARRTPLVAPAPAEASDRLIPTFGDAVEQWLRYLTLEKRRKESTVRDARNVARANLLGYFGADTPLYAVERTQRVVLQDGRQQIEIEERTSDTFDTADVDEFRRELLDTHLPPRTTVTRAISIVTATASSTLTTVAPTHRMPVRPTPTQTAWATSATPIAMATTSRTRRTTAYGTSILASRMRTETHR
jgi:hypothetical protein